MYLVISASLNEEKNQLLCSCFNGLAYIRTVCALLNKMCLINSQAVVSSSSSSSFTRSGSVVSLLNPLLK